MYLDCDEYTWNIDINEEQFENMFDNINKPIIIRDFYKNTKAYKTWTEENIKEKFGTTQLETSSYYENTSIWKNDKTQTTMTDFIQYLKENEKSGLYLAEVDLTELHINNELNSKVILDIYNPNYKKEEDFQFDALYFGKNPHTNIHMHIKDNYILNQVFGKKTVYFCDYYENNIETWSVWDVILDNYNYGLGYGKIYNEKNEMTSFHEMDHSKMKNIYKVDLNPGDSVLIPPWWWHATKGYNINCSITKVYSRKNLNYLFDKPFLLILVLFNLISNFTTELCNNIHYIIEYNYSPLLFFVVFFILFLLKLRTSSNISLG